MTSLSLTISAPKSYKGFLSLINLAVENFAGSSSVNEIYALIIPVIFREGTKKNALSMQQSLSIISKSVKTFYDRRLSFLVVVFSGISEIHSSDVTFRELFYKKSFSLKGSIATDRLKVRFFYSFEEKCTSMLIRDGFKVVSPESKGSVRFLKTHKKQLENESLYLTLSNGILYSKKEFITSPLFENTLEKHRVFDRLNKLHQSSEFKEGYRLFLGHIHSENVLWAESYLEDPISLSYFSLFAYLNQDITKEELFIVQMLASAFSEMPDSAEYRVIDYSSVISFLIEYNYIEESDRDTEFHFLRAIREKSLIERTAISYSFNNREWIDEEVVAATYKQINRFQGSVIYDEEVFNGRVCVMPPWLLKRLNAENSSLDNPLVDHTEIFGYRKVFADLQKGRPISYASPLFVLPMVHERQGTQLGVTLHDFFHVLLDSRFKESEKYIELGMKVLTLGKTSKAFATLCLDRAINVKLSSADNLKMLWLRGKVEFLPEETVQKILHFMKEIFGEKCVQKMRSSQFFNGCSCN